MKYSCCWSAIIGSEQVAKELRKSGEGLCDGPYEEKGIAAKPLGIDPRASPLSIYISVYIYIYI